MAESSWVTLSGRPTASMASILNRSSWGRSGTRLRTARSKLSQRQREAGEGAVEAEELR